MDRRLRRARAACVSSYVWSCVWLWVAACGAPVADPPSSVEAPGPAPTAPAAPPTAAQTLAPYFTVGDADALPLERTHASIRVEGPIADVTVTQVYRNRGTRPLEAIYVFPAGTRAAVHGLTMTIGQRVIEAQIRERAAARRDYEAARAAGKTASLLEQQRPNVFQMNVANILPGDVIEVELRYAELLVPTRHAYELVFPTVVGPRYSARPELEVEGGGPHLPAGAPAAHPLSVDARIDGPLPLRRIECPSHPRAVVRRTSERSAELTIAESDDAGDRDLVLRYAVDGDAIEGGVLVEPAEDGGHFLALLAPPARVEPAAIVPREYLFVVDVSGSMMGFPLEVARRAVARLLDSLRPEDRFDVLAFSGGDALYAPASVAATAAHRAGAARFLAEIPAGGGTELLPALERALALPRDPGRSRTIVVITDGYVTVEAEAFSLIRRSLGEANLFALGIGTAVNRHLIEGLARAGQGEPFVAASENEAAQRADELVAYVRAPVLTHVRARFEGLDAYDVTPAALPDVFAERPVVITGKYRGPATGRVVLEGVTAAGAFEQRVEIAGAPTSTGGTVARLWARQRIEALGDAEGTTRRHAAEITALGLAHRLMTSYTSFVAIDSRRRAGEAAVPVDQPAPMPRGVSDAAGGRYGSAGSESLEGSHLGALFGTGHGGGGTGEGTIGLGALGTIGAGGGAAGYGRGAGGLGGRTSSSDIVAGVPSIRGALDPAVIRRIIHRHLAELRFEYDEARLRTPGVAGRIVVRFVLGADGSVRESRVVSDTTGDAALANGVAAAVRRWTFPSFPGGGTVVVTYPFELKAR